MLLYAATGGKDLQDTNTFTLYLPHKLHSLKKPVNMLKKITILCTQPPSEIFVFDYYIFK